ncbi:LAMI_0G11210g1_1 [Lachancea mirantina]|uniref:LAMI_0G11210g1_1 n=1 Tax=Lachancea mirantina TaxID=1230905 RepID=A0A1G4KB54_9SACH|nr:LAMI_0G11210g1_1 [Lachancea mirantina]
MVNSNKIYPCYHVDLTHESLVDFEEMSTLCALESYDKILFFLESNMGLPRMGVPSSDVVIVLLTLATMCGAKSEMALKANDPYGVGRISLPVRCLKLLMQYVEILAGRSDYEFDPYYFKLLRCQFFNVADYILNWDLEHEKFTSKQKIKETEGFATTYNYIGIFEHGDRKVLKRETLSSKLRARQSLQNCVAWALKLSSSSDDALSAVGITWIQILNVLFELFELRCICLQKCGKKDDERDDSLKISWLTAFLRSFGVHNHSLCDLVFIGCEFTGQQVVPSDPIYREDPEKNIKRLRADHQMNDLSVYSYAQSMRLRHQILRVVFQVLRCLPEGGTRFSNEHSVIADVAHTLLNFQNMAHLKMFLGTIDFNKDNACFSKFVEKALFDKLKDLRIDVSSPLTEMGCYEDLLAQLSGFLKGSASIFTSRRQDMMNEVNRSLALVDLLVLVLLKVHIYKKGRTGIKNGLAFRSFMKALRLNDKMRHQFESRNELAELSLPRLLPDVKRIFDS